MCAVEGAGWLLGERDTSNAGGKTLGGREARAGGGNDELLRAAGPAAPVTPFAAAAADAAVDADGCGSCGDE